MADKKSSHLGAGLLAGAILGVAAGLFIQSPKGKKMTKEVDAKLKKLQKQLMKRLNEASDMSKEKYEELVDEIVAYYRKTKDIAQKDVPEVRAYLMNKWKEIEKQMKSV